MVFFYTFAGLCAALIAAMIWRPRLVFEYPYFMAVAATAFILPQAYGIYLHADVFGEDAISGLFLMCTLCLGACWLGYRGGRHQRKFAWLSLPLDFRRLFQGGVMLIIVSYIFRYSFRFVAPELLANKQWTGLPTILHFFTMLVYPGLAICVVCALQQRRLGYWLVTLLAAAGPLQDIIFSGRREQMAQLALMFALGWYFIRGKELPRLAIIGAIAFGAVFIPSVGEYRSSVQMGPLEALRQIDLVGNFRAQFAPDKPGEVKNAMVVIEATQRRGDYLLGAGYWNNLVFRFVPAQFVGRDFKDSLMIGGRMEDSLEFVRQQSNLTVTPGSLITGPGDAFRQFGYLGALFFFLCGLFFRRVWITALDPNALIAKVFYIQIAVTGMRSMTHQTTDFLPGVLYSAIFLGLVILYARKPAVDIPHKMPLPAKTGAQPAVSAPGRPVVRVGERNEARPANQAR